MGMVEPHGKKNSLFRGNKFISTRSPKQMAHLSFIILRFLTLVSQLLVELPRTLKGQHEVEFDLESI